MAVDQKYGTVAVSETPGNPLGDDEPVFIIRGRDMNAVAAIDAYADLCNANHSPASHIASIQNARQRFADWQQANTGLVKIPD